MPPKDMKIKSLETPSPDPTHQALEGIRNDLQFLKKCVGSNEDRIEMKDKEILNLFQITNDLSKIKPENAKNNERKVVNGDAFKSIVDLIDSAREIRKRDLKNRNPVFEDGVIEGLRLALEIAIREA